MHPTYRDVVLSRAQSAVGAARAVTGMTHNGLKGEIREIVLRDLLRPLLPADVGVGMGEIVSATGQTSRQQDVVLYDRLILPPILFEQSVGVFPIESVLFSIEVKSKLTNAELMTSDAAATALLGFDYAPGIYTAAGEQHHTVTKVVSGIFALDSDLAPAGSTEVERYDCVRAGPHPALRMICVVGRGCWYWDTKGWAGGAATYPMEEVVRFIAGLLNTYREVAVTRGQPRIGRYLL